MNYTTAPSKSGKRPLICFNDYTYCRDVERGVVTYYKCSEYADGCKARGKLMDATFATSETEHSHPARIGNIARR